MGYITYEEVVKLADQLSLSEQQALAAHLHERVQEKQLSAQEWEQRLQQAVVSVPPGPKFSDSREDWYGDDGR